MNYRVSQQPGFSLFLNWALHVMKLFLCVSNEMLRILKFTRQTYQTTTMLLITFEFPPPCHRVVLHTSNEILRILKFTCQNV